MPQKYLRCHTHLTDQKMTNIQAQLNRFSTGKYRVSGAYLELKMGTYVSAYLR